MPATETRPAHLAKNATVRRVTWSAGITAKVVRFKAATKNTPAQVLCALDCEPGLYGDHEVWMPAAEMVAA